MKTNKTVTIKFIVLTGRQYLIKPRKKGVINLPRSLNFPGRTYLLCIPGFSILALLTYWAREFLVMENHPMNCFNSIPDLYLLGASKHPHPRPNCDNQSMYSDVTKCPMGGRQNCLLKISGIF